MTNGQTRNTDYNISVTASVRLQKEHRDNDKTKQPRPAL